MLQPSIALGLAISALSPLSETSAEGLDELHSTRTVVQLAFEDRAELSGSKAPGIKPPTTSSAPVVTETTIVETSVVETTTVENAPVEAAQTTGAPEIGTSNGAGADKLRLGRRWGYGEFPLAERGSRSASAEGYVEGRIGVNLLMDWAANTPLDDGDAVGAGIELFTRSEFEGRGAIAMQHTVFRDFDTALSTSYTTARVDVLALATPYADLYGYVGYTRITNKWCGTYAHEVCTIFNQDELQRDAGSLGLGARLWLPPFAMLEARAGMDVHDAYIDIYDRRSRAVLGGDVEVTGHLRIAGPFAATAGYRRVNTERSALQSVYGGVSVFAGI